MGISPAAVLAVPAVAVGGDSAAATEPLRLAAGYLKLDDIKGESGVMPQNRPPAVFPKVEMRHQAPHPGNRPPAVFPKVEMRHPPHPGTRPPAAYHKIEPPPAAYHKTNRPALMPGKGNPYPGTRKP